MPVVQSPNKALVTGANGFVAMWVVRDLLEHGYVVRGTVRSVEKGEYLKNYFAPYASKFEVITVEDMSEEGAFDEAVKSVEAIAHVATPQANEGDTSRRYGRNCYKRDDGTSTECAHVWAGGRTTRQNQSVKRIVYASTGGAVWPETSEFQTFTVLTEEDWNVRAIEILKERGDETPAITAYHASKTLAEQSAWKFVKDHDGEMD